MGLAGASARAEEEGSASSKPAVVPIFGPEFSRPSGLPLGDPGAGVKLPAFVKPRAAWGAAPPAQPYVGHVPKGVSLHHTGAYWDGWPPPDQYLRNIQAFHVGPRREWEDIAYHFLIDLDGEVWAGRPPTVRGNPSIYYDPAGLVLICFIGDYMAQTPSESQIAAAARTAAWVIREYKLAPGPITGHRDHAPTTCPGDNVYQLLREGSFASRVRDELAHD